MPDGPYDRLLMACCLMWLGGDPVAAAELWVQAPPRLMLLLHGVQGIGIPAAQKRCMLLSGLAGRQAACPSPATSGKYPPDMAASQCVSQPVPFLLAPECN